RPTMSQQHADTLSPARADIDEALFGGRQAFRLPPEVPDLPPEPEPEPAPYVAVQCGDASYQLTDMEPGVLGLRPAGAPTAPPPGEEVPPPPEQAEEAERAEPERAEAEEEPRLAVYEVPPPLSLTLAGSCGVTVQAGETAGVTAEVISVSGAEPAVIDLM